MSQSHRHATRLLGVTALAVIALVTAAPTPAHAQLGGLLKKAKKAVASPGSDARAAGPAPQFDATMLELDASRVAHVLDGLAAEQHLRESATWQQRHAAAVHRRDATQDALLASSDRHAKDAEAFEKTSRRIHDCRDSVSYVLTRQHEHADESNSSATDAKMEELRTKMMEAVARGDAAATKKIQAEMMAAIQSPQQDGTASTARRSAADSAQMDRACGETPAQPPYVAEQDSLRAEIPRITGQIRAIEGEVYAAGVKASGLTDGQFAMAIERIQLYLQGESGFSHVELDAIHAKESELKALLKSLGQPLDGL